MSGSFRDPWRNLMSLHLHTEDIPAVGRPLPWALHFRIADLSGSWNRSTASGPRTETITHFRISESKTEQNASSVSQNLEKIYQLMLKAGLCPMHKRILASKSTRPCEHLLAIHTASNLSPDHSLGKSRRRRLRRRQIQRGLPIGTSSGVARLNIRVCNMINIRGIITFLSWYLALLVIPFTKT